MATLGGGDLSEALTATAALTVGLPAEPDWVWIPPDQAGILASSDGRVQVHFPPGAVNVPIEAGHWPLDPVDMDPEHHIFYRFELLAREAGQPNVPVPALTAR